MPPFPWQVVDGCTRVARGSEYMVKKEVTREDRGTVVQGGQNGEIQTKTVIAIVGAIGMPSLPCPLLWPYETWLFPWILPISHAPVAGNIYVENDVLFAF